MVGRIDASTLFNIKRLMLSAVVVFVLLGIYAAMMNMPVVTGCLNNECQLAKGGRLTPEAEPA